MKAAEANRIANEDIKVPTDYYKLGKKVEVGLVRRNSLCSYGTPRFLFMNLDKEETLQPAHQEKKETKGTKRFLGLPWGWASIRKKKG